MAILTLLLAACRAAPGEGVNDTSLSSTTSTPDGALDAPVDGPAATPDGAVDAPVDGPAATPDSALADASACMQGAALGGPYSVLDGAASDPRCPAAWPDLTSGNGDPVGCTVDGLICVYPQGQAECAPDGPVLKWWPEGSGQDCPERPPPFCSSCAMPGNVCGYITGPPAGAAFVTNLCCDGDSHRWTLEPSSGCPNGNVCGTIEASSYDQACTTDSDCTGVSAGNLCTDDCTNCINAAINVKALNQYNMDFATKVSVPRVCPCPSGPAPVCDAGVCGFAQ